MQQLMDVFYIGLSRLSTPRKTPGEKREALSSEARRILGILDREGPLAIEAGGRPYFADFHADFNISHSRDMAALAFSAPRPAPRPETFGSGGKAGEGAGEGKRRLFRVGCDIQYVNLRRDCGLIAERFFSRAERDFAAAGGDEGKRRFYMIWTLKECWLKLQGLSVFDMGKTPVFYAGPPRGERNAAGEAADFYLYELEGAGERYMLAAARERSPAPLPGPGASAAYLRRESGPVLRWFSETTLRVSSIDAIYAELIPEKTAMPKS
jgi:hypothetical protein